MACRCFAALLVSFLLPSAALAQPARMEMDRARSFIAVTTHKGGIGAFLAGHEHGILAAGWSSDVFYDSQHPELSRVTISIPVQSLRIDTAEAREKAGLNPRNGPGPEDVKKIQQTMLAPENLAAQAHPEIRFEMARAARKDNDTLLISGALTIRGTTRSVSAPVKISHPDRTTVHFSGKFRVKQSDYGIRPASVGGLVKVKDEVDIRFELYARVPSR